MKKPQSPKISLLDYKSSGSLIFILWMCILGYAKIPYIFYQLYKQQASTSNWVQSQQNFFLLFIAGAALGALSFIRFDYKRSRRVMILLAELSFGVGIIFLRLNLVSTQYYQIALGISASVSAIIYPLYLSEQSFQSEHGSLCNVLQFSIFVSAIAIKANLYLQDPNQWFYPMLAVISLVNGLIINFALPIAETITVKYMCRNQNRGLEYVKKLVSNKWVAMADNRFKEFSKRRWFLQPCYHKGEQVPLLDHQGTQDYKEQQNRLNLKVLLLAAVIPLSQVYSYQFIFNYNLFFYREQADEMQMGLTVVISFILSVAALILCNSVRHKKIFQKGFEALFISATVGIMETIVFTDQRYLSEILQYVQLIMYIILGCMVTSAGMIFMFSHISPNMLALCSLIFWASFAAAFFSPSNEATLGMQLAAGLVGYILSDFLSQQH